MNRYNGFAMSHKGLRAMLFSTALEFQQTDAADDNATDSVLIKLEQVLKSFDDHSELEDEYIFPLLETKKPELVDAFEKDHELDRMLTKMLGDSISLYRLSAPTERPYLWFQLFMAYNDFTAFNLGHMNREETCFNEAAWEFYTDDELIAVHKTIAASRTHEQKQISGYWMFRACNNTELTTWACELKKQLRPEAFEVFANNAQNILPRDRFATIFNLNN